MKLMDIILLNVLIIIETNTYIEKDLTFYYFLQ
jgi:hypothetical protein